ncbi:IS5/IS1182 family transposase, partial [Jeotgalibacillus proteolyticus]
YGSEENYQDVLDNRESTPLITYNTYRKEQKKRNQTNAFNTANWNYNNETDSFQCPNDQQLTFRYHSRKTDRKGFTREYKVYES